MTANLGTSGCLWTVGRVRAHRADVWELQRKLGRKRTPISTTSKIRSCVYARWVEGLWWKRLVALRHVAARRILPETNDWGTAVAIAQRPFPGTESWLLSCSGAEGGHGRWKTYGGGHYYPGFERLYVVGGPMQYKWPTFRGHYRHALDSLRERGFLVRLPGPDDVDAWLSMEAQALAAGWARWSGNDDSHWSASWDRGCR